MALANEATICRNRSGDAPCRCCSSNPSTSILCGAAIAVILSVSSLVGTHQDHAVAVLRHDATPFSSESLVHHLRGRSLLVNPRTILHRRDCCGWGQVQEGATPSSVSGGVAPGDRKTSWMTGAIVDD